MAVRKYVLWAVALALVALLSTVGPVLAYGGGVGGGSQFSSRSRTSGGSSGSRSVSYSTPSQSVGSSVTTRYTTIPTRTAGSSTYYPSAPSRNGGTTVYYVSSSRPVYAPVFISPVSLGLLLAVILVIAIVWGISRVSLRRFRFQQPRIHAARLQIALLSTASADVTAKLDQLVNATDTTSREGLAYMLKESALLLLREQPYWHAAKYEEQQVPEASAEAAFNSLTIESRAKLSYEKVSNVDGQTQVDTTHPSVPAEDIEPGDYIVVTLIVARIAPNLAPKDDGPDLRPEDLRRRLADLAATPEERLRAFNVVWQPDDPREALSRDDLIVTYPDLMPI